MKRHRSLFIFLSFSATLALPASALADIIYLKSDLQDESNNITTYNVRITWLYPYEWQDNGADYFWVSYADTGYPPPPYTHAPWPENVTDISQAPTAIFYENFFLPYDHNTGSVTIWADDTAAVRLGYRPMVTDEYFWSLLYPANFIQDTYCAAGPIGCQPSEGLTIDLTALNLRAGHYQLRLDAYQRHSGPFGVMYTGQVESVPEPATIFLVAAGLAALFMAPRRRRTPGALKHLLRTASASHNPASYRH